MALVVTCASHLEPFFEAVIANKWTKASGIFDKISDDENQADDLKKQFRLNMPKSLFMPVSRGDLLGILAQQDNIANTTKDVCGIVLGREMDIPSVLQADFIAYVKSAIETCEKARKAMEELDELLVPLLRRLIEEAVGGPRGVRLPDGGRAGLATRGLAPRDWPHGKNCRCGHH